MNASGLKSIVAVLAGIIVIIILSTGTDALMIKLGAFPPLQLDSYTSKMLITALIYRGLYAIVGGYITSRIAPDKPMKHAIVLGVIGTILSILGAIIGWNLSEHWYPIALVLIAIPCSWIGGKYFTTRIKFL